MLHVKEKAWGKNWNQEMGLTPADLGYFSHSALEPSVHYASYPTEAPHLKKKGGGDKEFEIKLKTFLISGTQHSSG